MASKISFSQFSMFLECNYRWYLAYIKSLRNKEDNMYSMFGTAIHHSLQTYLTTYYGVNKKTADEIDIYKLLSDKIKELVLEHQKEYNKNICTLKEVLELVDDSKAILNHFKLHVLEYFPINYKLLGIEIPIKFKFVNGVEWIGFIDAVVKDTTTGRIKIIDFKTSTSGWKDYQKNSITKYSQLLLYKKFYSLNNNVPMSDIDLEFFIVLRKTSNKFVQKRIQLFNPPSDANTFITVMTHLKNFIATSFDINGEYVCKDYAKSKSDKACRFCEFNKTEHCCGATK